MWHETWATYKEKSNFGHSSGRKKSVHKETDGNFNEGGEEWQPLVWGTELCLLDGDGDFGDDWQASKIMRQECGC